MTGRPADVRRPPAEPAHLPPACEQQVRSHAAELIQLAARHGITALAFASPGRLRGHVADDRDLFDMFEFQRAAADLLSAEATVYSDGALRNQHVSPDLVTATALSATSARTVTRYSNQRPRPARPRPCAMRATPPGPTGSPLPLGPALAVIAVGNEALAGSTADQDFGLAAGALLTCRDEYVRDGAYSGV